MRIGNQHNRNETIRNEICRKQCARFAKMWKSTKKQPKGTANKNLSNRIQYIVQRTTLPTIWCLPFETFPTRRKKYGNTDHPSCPTSRFFSSCRNNLFLDIFASLDRIAMFLFFCIASRTLSSVSPDVFRIVSRAILSLDG